MALPCALDDVGEGDDAYPLHGLKDLMAKRDTQHGQAVADGQAGEGEAREGDRGTKIPYGFRVNAAGDAYVMDEETMAVVRRNFRMVADTANLYAVQQ